MQVSEQELRELVREAIARHSGQPAQPVVSMSSVSFGKFIALAPTEDGQCVIEPTVRCNHCGYCQSYGH